MKRIFILFLVVLSAVGCARRGGDVSVMSFNIRLCVNETMDGENNWIYRKEAVVEMLNEVSPDLFGVQEGGYDQVCFMDEYLPQYGRYGVESADGLNDGDANAIFYKLEKFELLDKGTFWLSATPDTVSMGWDGAYNRVVAWVRLKDKSANNQEILFLNTHFDHVGTIAREESGKLIVDKIKELSHEGTAVFLVGDFNTNHDDPLLMPIRNFMVMAREAAPFIDTINTFHNWGKVPYSDGSAIIDHIFSLNAEIVNYKTMTEEWGVKYLSDHYPVIGEFKY